MKARDLMQTDVLVVHEDLSARELFEIFVLEHVTGAPVVDRDGRFVGIVTQEDAWFGCATLPGAEEDPTTGVRVRDIMTSPAFCASEDTDLNELAEMMWKLHLHRLPVVKGGRVSGVVSSIDLCKLISTREVPTTVASF
jgi:CBS domain-containing protein